MANYSSLKSAVTSVIKTNGNKEITGAVLQSTLLAIINSLGDGFLFKGVATPSTNPGTPDQNVFYIGGAGTYTNFNSLEVPTGYLGVLKYNGVWAVSTVQVGAVPVNDLTTGGTTVPLSAEMGKTLKTYHDDNASAIQAVNGQVSQLEHKVDGLDLGTGEWQNNKTIDPTTGELINSTGVIASTTYFGVPNGASYIQFLDEDISDGNVIWYCLAFYDYQKNILSRSSYNSKTKWDLPANTSFVRIILQLYDSEGVSIGGDKDDYNLGSVLLCFNDSVPDKLHGVDMRIDSVENGEKELRQIDQDILGFYGNLTESNWQKTMYNVIAGKSYIIHLESGRISNERIIIDGNVAETKNTNIVGPNSAVLTFEYSGTLELYVVDTPANVSIKENGETTFKELKGQNGWLFSKKDTSGIVWNSGYRNATSYATSPSGSIKSSAPIFVKKGTMISFENFDTAITVVSLGEISADGVDYIRPIFVGNGSRMWYSYIAEKDMYIEICKDETHLDSLFYIFEMNANPILEILGTINGIGVFDKSKFELGNLTAGTHNPPVLADSTSRIRLADRKSIRLFTGDVVSIESDARFYLMWYGANGWSTAGWKASYEITETADYYILARYRTETAIEDAVSFAQKLSISHKNGKQDQLTDGNVKTINGLSLLGGGNISIKETPIRPKTIKNYGHRGYMASAVPQYAGIPENTPYSMVKAAMVGFDGVEIDVNFTSDHIPIVLHDNTINRTARNADGTEIVGNIDIRSITYAQALEYDFGIAYGEQYAGLKLPTFEEIVEVVRNLGLELFVEIKNGTEAEIQSLYPIVRDAGMLERTSWFSDNYASTKVIKNLDNKAKVGLLNTSGAAITETQLSRLAELSTGFNKVFYDTNYSSDEECATLIAMGYEVGYYMVDSVEDAMAAPIGASMMTSNIVLPSELLKQKMYEDYPVD